MITKLVNRSDEIRRELEAARNVNHQEVARLESLLSAQEALIARARHFQDLIDSAPARLKEFDSRVGVLKSRLDDAITGAARSFLRGKAWDSDLDRDIERFDAALGYAKFVREKIKTLLVDDSKRELELIAAKQPK